MENVCLYNAHRKVWFISRSSVKKIMQNFANCHVSLFSVSILKKENKVLCYLHTCILCFPVSSSQAPATNWIDSMKKCEPGYLFGNVDLGMPSQYCNLSTTDSQVHWIGVARQKYTSEDQGASFMHCIII